MKITNGDFKELHLVTFWETREPGFTKLTLKPHPIKEIGSFAVKYRTSNGIIETEWHYEGECAVFTYSVPDGIEVTVDGEFLGRR